MSIPPSIRGVSLGSVEVSKSASHLGEAMYDAAKRGGLLITLDEIQDASTEEMRELGNEMQLLIRQGANVAFAFAGLPTSVMAWWLMIPLRSFSGQNISNSLVSPILKSADRLRIQ